ncbi:hypothetical protein [Streptomyces sp. NPDC006999]|uniref:hypothetical protein n=1 Tax=Streptomyces sp. NPDC006999 TaxID=3156909 RepID=UPI0033E020E0
MRAGALFAHLTWARLTSATDCSSSPGLPTPAARDFKGGGQRGQLPTAVGSLLPTPSTSENTGAGHAAQGGMNLRHVVSLLPTPRASENENRQTRRSPSQEAGTHGKSLAAEVGGAAADADRNGREGQQRSEPGLGTRGDPDRCGPQRWGQYGPAVARWEEAIGRPAPGPVDAVGRLSPVFVEWLMGLPAGHVTAVPGLSRTAQLKALGNGVVPQRAVAALRFLAPTALPARAAA